MYSTSDSVVNEPEITCFRKTGFPRLKTQTKEHVLCGIHNSVTKRKGQHCHESVLSALLCCRAEDREATSSGMLTLSHQQGSTHQQETGPHHTQLKLTHRSRSPPKQTMTKRKKSKKKKRKNRQLEPT